MTAYGFVIPVFNHPYYLNELIATLSQYKLPVIVVNDGSNDECSMQLRALDQAYPQLHLLEHDHNQGKGQAVMTGLHYAGQIGLTHALQLDADGQHHWADIDKFLQLSQQQPDAVVIGQPIFDTSVPRKRLYARYVTHVWVWINTLSLDIQDSMCGFRVYPLISTLKILKQNKLQSRMGFDSEILVRLKWGNVKFINVPTPVIYPEQGISHFNVWRDNLSLSQAHARLFAGMLLRLPKLIKQKIQG